MATCKVIVLPEPEAGKSVHYEIPTQETAQLSFGADQISGLRINDFGALEITFTNGGNATITNFQDMVDSGNLLYLNDGTLVDPALLTAAIAPVQAEYGTCEVMNIGAPDAGVTREVTMETGNQYILDFDGNQAQSAEAIDGKLVITFENGGVLVVNNYDKAINGDLPAELSLADGSTIVEGEELLISMQQPGDAPAEEVLAVVEEEIIEENGRKSDVENADLGSRDDIGANGETQQAYEAAAIEPASGREEDLASIAEALQEIEPAAGDTGGAAGGRGGYGFNSSPTAAPLGSIDDVGPINPTQLQYQRPEFNDDTFIAQAEPDDQPIFAGPFLSVLDETNLANGNLVDSGQIIVSFGQDGPGTIMPNNDATVSGSFAGTELTSGGVVVDIITTTDGYTGSAAGVPVFDIVIDPVTGEYTYTQYQPFDNADPNDPNDEVILNFGVKATDADGDVTNTTIEVRVADDAPLVLSQTPKTIDESDFNGNPYVLNGSFSYDVGQDVDGTVTPSGTHKLSGSLAGPDLMSGGEVVTITPTNDGYVGKLADGTFVFNIDIDPSTGDYEYTQYRPFDHADGNDPDDIITLQFGATVTDFDGDQASGFITINVKDDAPVIGGQQPNTVDETDMDGATLTASAQFVVSGGADAVAGYSPEGAGSFSAGGSFGTQLTSGGQPVTVTVNGDTYTGTAGGNTVFTLEVDPTTGVYTYTQFETLDHADTTNPDDTISLEFGITAVDGDGNKVSGPITIYVKDDGPSISPVVVSVDETDLPAGGSLTGTYSGDFGEDGAGTIGATGSFTSSGSQLGGALTHHGVDVVVTYDAATNTYTGKAADKVIFTMTVKSDGTYQFDLESTLDHGDPNDPNDIINLDFGVEIVDGDGDSETSFIRVQVKDDVPVIGNAAGDVDETNFDTGPLSYADTIDHSFGLELGAIEPNGTGPTGVTTGGVPVVTTVSGNTFTGTANGRTVFTLEIDPLTGQYTYTQFIEIDHPDSNDANDVVSLDFGVLIRSSDGTTDTGVITIRVADDGPVANDDINGAEEGQLITGDVTANDDLSEDNPNVVTKVTFNGTDYPITAGGSVTIDTSLGKLVMNSDGTYQYTTLNNDPSGVDQFTYTLRDNDGDTDTAKLSITVTPDGQPVAVSEQLAVDETNLTPGPMIFNEHLDIEFGIDGAGTVAPNGSVTPGGSLLGGTLTSGNVPVDVTFENNTYTGKAGNVTVFTLQINNDGSYSFQLFEHIDHADNTDPNDVITLDFGVTVSDADGDTADGNIEILIYDDAPVAYDDGATSLKESETVTGNVTTNDELSEDRPNNVVEVRFNGTSHNVPANGVATINGQYGQLKIASDGSYTYEAHSNNPQGTDTFTYVLQDFDGDRDTATFSFAVDKINDLPVIVDPAAKTIDETNLGPITVNGQVDVDYLGDGPGAITINGDFTSGGSRTGGTLSHNGFDIVVTQNGNQYVGKAGNVTVFTLDVNADGSYSFTLLEQLDHADGNDDNDVINLNFGITATDADGDTDTSIITIRVKDDAPIAENDARNADEGQTISGNVMTNDTVGQDEPGSITKIDGQTIGANGVTINGTYGTLTIKSDGSYTYKANSNNPDGTDTFTYTLVDADGDTDTATLKITVSPDDDQPIVTGSTKTVDETGGFDSVSGKVTVDYGSDGPGTVSTNGAFTTSIGALTSLGEAVVVTNTGATYTGVAGGRTIFTLTVNTDGTYTFKQLDQIDHPDATNPDDSVQLRFGVKATDADGDNGTALIKINVKDDGPIAENDSNSASESNTVATGNLMLNDTVGADEPGHVSKISNGTNSKPVPDSGDVTIQGQYGELVVKADGTYTYTLTATNVPDTAQEVFFYTLADSDDDTDTAKLTINLTGQDDHPEIIVPCVCSSVVDETDLGPIQVTDKVEANYFGDGPGKIEGTGLFSSAGSRTNDALTSNGKPVNVQLVGNEYVGKADGETIFIFKIEEDGNYTFTLFGNLDHADGNDDNDIILLSFGVKATDADGDMSASAVQIKVKDDIPTIDTTFVAVDETDLVGGPLSVTDTIPHDFGADDAGEINVTGNFVAKFEMDGPNVDLTSKGTDIVVTKSGNGYVGMAGGRKVFDLTLDKTTGEYTYKQYDQIDHPDASNPDDVIWLKFQVEIVDYDGDSELAYIGIDVHDDGPVANKDTMSASEDQTITGNVTDNDLSGADEPATIVKVSINGQDVTVPQNGNAVSINGQYGTLTIKSDGSYSYKANGNNPDGQDNFTYVLKDFDGDTDTAELCITVSSQNDVPVLTGSTKTVDETGGFDTVNGSVSVDYGNDGPGSVTTNGAFTTSIGALTSLGQAVTVTNTGTTYTGVAGGRTIFTLTVNTDGTYTFKQLDQIDHPDATNPDDSVQLRFGVKATDGDGDAGTALIKINVKDGGPSAVNDTDSVNETDTSASGNLMTNDTVGADAPGQITEIKFGSTTKAVSDTGSVTIQGQYGELIVKGDGSYTYNLTASNIPDTAQEVFNYKLSDFDGDTANAKLTVNLSGTDDHPVILVPCEVTIDETDLGPIEISDKVLADFFSDGPGTVEGTGNFSSEGSRTNDALTSNGHAVSVAYTNGQYVGTANGKTIFTLVIKTDGNYTFTLFDRLDHADGTNPNDVIELKFGMKVVDADGDMSASHISVFVKDDAPYAENDFNGTSEGQTVSGNVMSNDTVGADAPGKITHINGQAVGSSKTIAGTYGTLTIKSDGSYTYTAKSNNPDGQDVFTYKLADKDGDVDTAQLKITVTPVDSQPVANDDRITQDNFVGGDTFRGNLLVNDDFGQDGPGSPKVILNVGTFKFDHGTLTVKANGDYKLVLDRSVTYNHNYELAYRIQDADGDTATAYLRFTVTPLVLDLDGDGIELTSVGNGVLFDYDVDGEAEQTAWVQSDDGFLVFDRNEDGIINDRSEMFGDMFGYANGFAHLGSFDTDGDHKITSLDDGWQDLQVWRDLNQDGISDENELFGLDELGIASINVDSNVTDYTVEGNYVSRDSTYTTTDGEVHYIADVNLDYDELNPEDQMAMDISNYLVEETEVDAAINEFVYQTDAPANVDTQTASGLGDGTNAAALSSGGDEGLSIDLTALMAEAQKVA